MKILWMLCLFACSIAGRAEPPEIRFFNWSDYLPEELLERFTAETGIRVRYSTYDGNEAMYAKIKLLRGKGYDLAMPSTYYVDKMRKEGLLHPLDRARLPGFKNLDPRLLDQSFDPGNAYSVPYLWGSTGLAVNVGKIDPAKLRTWADLWRPEFRRGLLLPNDMREVFFVALKTLGHSGNSIDPAELKQAYEKLRQLLPNVRLFNSDSAHLLYVTGEVDAGVIWNGNAYRAHQEDSKLRYVYPKEGAMLWMDNLVIPAGAENVAEAHRLIDFLLRPEIAKIIAEKLTYASPNVEAVKLLPKELRDDPIIYPPEEELRKGEYSMDIGSAVTLYAEYWEKLKAGE
jgi:spermidine/putrescine transport system substrate-binding protein